MANRALVSSLEDEMNAGRSLALIRPEAPRFSFRRLSDAELRKATRRRRELVAQASLFGGDSILPDQPPYTFIYKFVHAGKKREFQCIDWETDATFLKWRNLYGEQKALENMQEKFGVEYPEKGVVFAMGTHRVRHWKSWLLSGVIRADHTAQEQFQL